MHEEDVSGYDTWKCKGSVLCTVRMRVRTAVARYITSGHTEVLSQLHGDRSEDRIACKQLRNCLRAHNIDCVTFPMENTRGSSQH